MKYIYIILSASLLLLASCDKENNDGDLVEDTLYVKNGGTTMPVNLHGNISNKAIVILLHGGPGGSGLEYRSGKYAQELEKKFVMAYWDQRGQGMSLGNAADDLNIALMVDDLEKVIRTIKFKYGADKSIFLFGHSWGGLLGSAFMIDTNRQALVNGWIESNGAHDLPRLNKSSVQLFKDVATAQINLANSVAQWQAILDWANAIDTNNITSEISGQINQKGREVEQYLLNDGVLAKGEEGGKIRNPSLDNLRSSITGNATNGKLNDEIEKAALTPMLSNITKPCLFLFSAYDFIVPPQLGIDAHREVNTTEKKLVIFQKSGHSPMDNEADLFIQEFGSFVMQYK